MVVVVGGAELGQEPAPRGGGGSEPKSGPKVHVAWCLHTGGQSLVSG